PLGAEEGDAEVAGGLADPAAPAEDEQQGDADDRVRDGQRQIDDGFDDAAAWERVAGEGERQWYAEDGGDDGGDRGILQAEENGGADVALAGRVGEGIGGGGEGQPDQRQDDEGDEQPAQAPDRGDEQPARERRRQPARA